MNLQALIAALILLRALRAAMNNPFDDFRTLCTALMQNDPTVVHVSTHSIADANSWWFGQEERLKKQFTLALKHNTVVTSIRLDLWNLYTFSSETPGINAAAIQPLLHFMEHNLSLSTVVLEGGPSAFTGGSGSPLALMIVNALVQNSLIQSFESNLSIPVNTLTTLLLANQKLKRLVLHINHDNENSDATIQAVAAAARSLAALPALVDVCLVSYTSVMTLSPFLTCLSQSNAAQTVQRLKLQWSTSFLPDISMLPDLLTSSKRLTELVFTMKMDRHEWNLVSAGLQANPNIASLCLDNCLFTLNAITLLLEEFQLLHKLSKLQLSKCRYEMPTVAANANAAATTANATATDTIAANMARMLCRCLVQQVTLDYTSLLRLENQRAFADAIMGTTALGTRNHSAASAARLRTLHLLDMSPSILRHISVYLPTTVHLYHLTIEITFQCETLVIPKEFPSSMRHNASLRSVKLCDGQGHDIPGRTRAVGRYMRACMRRNRMLPKLLAAAIVRANLQQDNTAAVSVSPSHLLPTLCTAAMQGRPMAPTSILIGLLASLGTLGPAGNDGKRRNGRRS